MGFFDELKGSVNDFFERRKQDQLQEQQLQTQMRQEEAIEYRKQFVLASREAMIINARKRAQEKTGLAKLRAINQVHNLENPSNQNPASFLGKLADYTKQNRMRRDSTLAKTQAIRQEVMRQKQERIGQRTPSGGLRRIGNSTGLRKRGSLY